MRIPRVLLPSSLFSHILSLFLTHFSRRGLEGHVLPCYLNVQFSLFLELSLQVRHVIVLEEFDLARGKSDIWSAGGDGKRGHRTLWNFSEFISCILTEVGY